METGIAVARELTRSLQWITVGSNSCARFLFQLFTISVMETLPRYLYFHFRSGGKGSRSCVWKLQRFTLSLGLEKLGIHLARLVYQRRSSFRIQNGININLHGLSSIHRVNRINKAQSGFLGILERAG